MPTIERETYRDRRYAEWYVVLGFCAMIGAAVACWKIGKVAFAPSTEEAMTRSLAELRVPELTTAYTLHPDTCSIRKAMWSWSVECVGVPIYFYQDLTLCDPGPPRTCGVVPSEYKNCRTFFWDIDLDGRPSNPIGDRGRYASVEESCNPKGTLVSDREEMARRGITPNRVEILDYAGSYTGSPRAILRQ
jgi:hypothetical protein